MADHSDLNPENLRRGLVNESRTKLKPGLTTDNYTSGTPSNANQIKPSLRTAAGALKAGLLTAAGNLKPSIRKLFGEAGGGGPVVPALAIRDRAGNPILDRAGNFIESRV